MQVDETERGYVIVRGKERDVFFCFFVDHDSSTWSNLAGAARFYDTKEQAEDDLAELRRRNRTRERRTRDEVKAGLR
jgi:hypothetical protein